MIATIAAMKIMVEYIVGNVSKGTVVLLFFSVIALFGVAVSCEVVKNVNRVRV